MSVEHKIELRCDACRTEVNNGDLHRVRMAGVKDNKPYRLNVELCARCAKAVRRSLPA